MSIVSSRRKKSKKSTSVFLIPDRKKIIKFLDNVGRPQTRKELAIAFNISDVEIRRALGKRLKAMTQDGELVRNRRGSYGLLKKMDLYKGYVIGHPDGYGFVVSEKGGKDLYLSTKQMRTVLHGDNVVVRLISTDKKGRREGVLVKVLQRANHYIVGKFFRESGISYVVPDNKRISQDILIPSLAKNKVKQGQYVVVEILHQPEKHRQPIGKISNIISDSSDADMAVDIAIRSYELPFNWSDEIKNEIDGLTDDIDIKKFSNRHDYRDIPFVTIDGEDARDFDDAVFCEKLDNCWRLIVAIADVSYYVKKESAFDKEAYLRGTSVYFPNRVIPMLPEVLSNGLCSLKPNIDRLSLVCELKIDAHGKVKDSIFKKAIICSQARLTYSEMSEIVVDKNKKQRDKHLDLLPHLDNLYKLYELLHSNRKKEGLIDFSSIESRFIFNNEGKVDSIELIRRNNAHRLIEEMMLIANIAAGEFIEKHTKNGIYRIHDTPKDEKLKDLNLLLSKLGLSLESRGKPTAKHYASLVEKIRKREDGQMLETILLRSMPLAEYSESNKGHFGLGFPVYTHFTSPIRRYPDLIVHRIISHLIDGEASLLSSYKRQIMLDLATHCSNTERRAEDATRDATQRLKCNFMKDKEGEIFQGIVSTVASFGLFVLLDDLHVEGLIHISTLPTDYYHYDPISHTLIGERSGKIFALGERLVVKLICVDIDERKIDFELYIKNEKE